MSLGSILRQNYQQMKQDIDVREKNCSDEYSKQFRQVLEDKFPDIREQLIKESRIPNTTVNGREFARHTLKVNICFDIIKYDDKNRDLLIELAEKAIKDFFKVHDLEVDVCHVVENFLTHMYSFDVYFVLNRF